MRTSPAGAATRLGGVVAAAGRRLRPLARLPRAPFLAVLLIGVASLGAAAQQSQPNADKLTLAQRSAVQDVLSQLQDGLEGHIEHMFLDAFDQDNMQAFDQFNDQVDRLFEQVSMFRVEFRVLSVHMRDRTGQLFVDTILVEQTAHGERSTEQELRLDLTLTKRGWKVGDLQPRTLFTPPN